MWAILIWRERGRKISCKIKKEMGHLGSGGVQSYFWKYFEGATKISAVIELGVLMPNDVLFL